MKLNLEKVKLKILYLEDSAIDTELIYEILVHAGFDQKMDCAVSEKEYTAFLRSNSYDIILADFNLPGFDAFGALRLSRDICPDVPFICVSGSIGEESAVEILKQGAIDYVLKDRLEKLPSAIKRALAETREKQALHITGRALQASETRYRRLFETAQNGILILYAETGIIIDVNRYLVELLDFSYEQFQGKKIWELGPFKYIIPDQAAFEDLQQKGNLRYEDKPLETVEGKMIDVEFVSYAYNVNQKRVIQCNIWDITARKRTEKALVSLNLRQESILSAVPDIIMEVNNDKVYTWANRTGIDFFGDDVIGKEARYYFEGEQDTYDLVQPAFYGDENVIYVESFQRRKDGEKRLLAWRCRSRKDENGNVIGVLSSAQDITDYKRSKDALVQIAREWQATFDASSDAIWMLDREQRVVRSNKASELLFKSSRDEFIGNHCYEIVHGTSEPVCECPLLLAKKSHSRETMELQIDGSWFAVVVDPIFDAAGKFDGAVHFVSNITERKKAKEEIQELARFPSENPNPVLRILWNGTLLYVNAAGSNMLPEWHLKAGNRVVPILIQEVLTALKSESTHCSEFECGDRIFSFFISPFSDRGYANLYGFDITERKHAEEEKKKRAEELERFYHLAVGRESKMIELKQEINELSGRLGLKQPYPLDFLETGNK